MSVESSTPETAAAKAIYNGAGEGLRAHGHWLSNATKDSVVACILDALAEAGFTVVSGGEGLQHGDRIERGRPDFWDVEQRPVYRASGAAPGTTPCLVDEDGGVCGRSDCSRCGAAPGTTAEPAPAAFVATDLTYCITHRCLGHDDGRAWTACRFGQLFYEEAGAAGATAPETPVSWKERVGCSCKPGDGTDECARYDECYAAWHADTYPATAPETTPAACSCGTAQEFCPCEMRMEHDCPTHGWCYVHGDFRARSGVAVGEQP